MLNCYIVDDESHAIDVLARYIKKTDGLELAGSNEDPVKALMEVKEVAPDIIFLDIDMPVLTGNQFSKLVSENTCVAFTTASPDHAVDAFTDNVADYLLKPISYERFLKCIGKVERSLKTAKPAVVNDEYFFIQCEMKSKLIRMSFEDISYIESLNNYVIIYHNGQKHISYITLKEICDFLPNQNFSRVHKSFIINDKKIKAIEGNQIFLTEKTESIITIGNAYRENFLNKIMNKSLKRKV